MYYIGEMIYFYSLFVDMSTIKKFLLCVVMVVWGVANVSGQPVMGNDPSGEDSAFRDDIRKEAEQAQSACQWSHCKFRKTPAEKKADCLKDNPGEEWFCDCVANGWIKLNTNIPFIGRCIRLSWSWGDGKDGTVWATSVSQVEAFPRLMRALMNILMTVILVASLIMIIAGGVMIASSGAASWWYEQGKSMIRKVIIGLILLGASGLILALINPNFFG